MWLKLLPVMQWVEFWISRDSDDPVCFTASWSQLEVCSRNVRNVCYVTETIWSFLLAFFGQETRDTVPVSAVCTSVYLCLLSWDLKILRRIWKLVWSGCLCFSTAVQFSAVSLLSASEVYFWPALFLPHRSGVWMLQSHTTCLCAGPEAFLDINHWILLIKGDWFLQI